MRYALLLLIGSLAFVSVGSGQGSVGIMTLPGTCKTGTLVFNTSDAKLYVCSSTDVWAQVGVGGGGGVPAGLITLAFSACPAGWTESAALNGVMLRGTLAANADVGTTGGADAITPAGTVTAPTLTMTSYTPAGTVSAPVFTGNSVASSLVSGGTPAGTNGTAAFTPAGTIAAHTVVATKQGAAAGNVVTTATHVFVGTPGTVPAQVFAGTALGTHQHTTTATGTNSAPVLTGTPATLTGTNSVPVLTGTAFDNRPAFTRVIFCRKD